MQVPWSPEVVVRVVSRHLRLLLLLLLLLAGLEPPDLVVGELPEDVLEGVGDGAEEGAETLQEEHEEDEEEEPDYQGAAQAPGGEQD